MSGDVAPGAGPDDVAVVIVDDQPPFRLAARSVVKATAGFQVVGEASSGTEAIDLVDRLHPQLVLMDINMDGMSGIEASRRILQDHRDVSIVLLSTYAESDLPADARSCGAIAYIHKERFGPDVLDAVWRERAVTT